jgi:BspA type Leucine rich repeat region (6 copies)
MMKFRILILLISSLPLTELFPLAAQAQVNYAVSGNMAYVTNSYSATGNIVIASAYGGFPVTSIGEDAFYGCHSLTNVAIPNSIKNIGDYAFGECYSLTNIIVPDSITNIGDYAFSVCISLTNITFLGNAPTPGNNVFTRINAAATVYYYYGTSGWETTYGGLPTVELDAPSNPPRISSGSVGVQSGNFGFTLTGVANQTIVVEASTNLINWQPIWTNILTGTSVTFTDSWWTNHPSRYYRVR